MRRYTPHFLHVHIPYNTAISIISPMTETIDNGYENCPATDRHVEFKSETISKISMIVRNSPRSF